MGSGKADSPDVADPRAQVVTEQAPQPTGRYSQGIIAAGRFVFVSGQVPRDPASGKPLDGPMGAQVRLTLANLRAVLEAAGANLSSIVMLRVYLRDLGNRRIVDDLLSEMVPSPWPARTTVGVDLGQFEVELDAIAVVSASQNI